jgi:hypothetical protein
MTVERYATGDELAPLLDAAAGLLSAPASWLLAQARRDAVPHEAKLREPVGGAARPELGERLTSTAVAQRYIGLADRRAPLTGNEVSPS